MSSITESIFWYLAFSIASITCFFFLIAQSCLFGSVLTQCLQDMIQVDVVYADPSKALNQLDPSILLSKFELFALVPSSVRFVAYNLYITTWILQGIMISIPHWSNLGPLLFLLFPLSFVWQFQMHKSFCLLIISRSIHKYHIPTTLPLCRMIWTVFCLDDACIALRSKMSCS